MFKINLAELSDFDTQVLTLINLSPGSWSLGSHPTMGGHARDDLLRRGADPALTSAAFKGDVAAQGVLLDWIEKHM